MGSVSISNKLTKTSVKLSVDNSGNVLQSEEIVVKPGQNKFDVIKEQRAKRLGIK